MFNVLFLTTTIRLPYYQEMSSKRTQLYTSTYPNKKRTLLRNLNFR